MFVYDELNALQIELTSKCQASCPMCLRNVYGGLKNSHLIIDEWTFEEFKDIITEDILKRVNHILLCGQYGDPLLNPYLKDICRYITEINPNVLLVIHTNGSLYKEEWWKDFANILPKYHSVVFGIDGLEDTHSIYRIGTDYNKIISNMKAFISAGGLVTWDFIRFNHNEHQVNAARELSKQLGCQSFAVKDTSRFIDNNPYPVLDKDGNILYHLQPSTETQSGFVTSYIVDNYKKILEETFVECYSQVYKRIYLDSSKRVFPCAMHGTTINPSPLYNDILDPLRQEAVRETQEIFKNIENDATKKTIKEIINSSEWQEIWHSYAGNQKRCLTCTKNCGQFDRKFITKFCDEDIERSPLRFD